MNGIHAGTLHLSDAELTASFESCALPAAEFHHADHIRLAWIYIRQFGEVEASRRIVAGIQRFAERNGAPGKFHVTKTLAWMALVAEAHRSTSEIGNFSEFAIAHPHLFDPQRLLTFYSTERLECDDARTGWMEPDIRSLR
jgi:hypothetical protein